MTGVLSPSPHTAEPRTWVGVWLGDVCLLFHGSVCLLTVATLSKVVLQEDLNETW